MSDPHQPPAACDNCHRVAKFGTPHGDLCLHHTLEVMEADNDLWMPEELKRTRLRPATVDPS